ncbi:MAG: type II CAAX endopeptidase family protein [Chloroflexota bacterium]
MNFLKDEGHRRNFIIFSPVLLIVIGRLIAQLAGPILDVWVWVPLVITFWVLFFAFVVLGDGWQSLKRWVSGSRQGWGWSLLAVAIGLVPLQLMISNFNLFESAWLIIAWIVFAVVNAPLEEFYWRGLLLDAISNWPGWLGVLYTSFLFAINHTLTLGVYSIANRHPATLVSTFVMGVIWALAYKKTGSLRWAIVGHFLVDIFNLSVLAFLNLYIPPPLP